MGILSGDTTSNLLCRMEMGEFQGAYPKVVVISIGINDWVYARDKDIQVDANSACFPPRCHDMPATQGSAQLQTAELTPLSGGCAPPRNRPRRA